MCFDDPVKALFLRCKFMAGSLHLCLQALDIYLDLLFRVWTKEPRHTEVRHTAMVGMVMVTSVLGKGGGLNTVPTSALESCI